MTTAARARRGTYAGVFLVCLATLFYELLLTRIFSVTMWYHFAFMAVSIAMFGMTVGAIAVYLRPAWFPAETVHRQLAGLSLLFAAALVPSFLAHLVIPFAPQVSVLGLYSVALTYVLIAVPFVLSGVTVSLALTRFPDDVGRVYAADLLGAAMACPLFILLLRVTDAPTAVVATAALAGLAAFAFAGARAGSALLLGAAALEVLLLVWVGYGSWRAWRAYPLIRLAYVKEAPESRPIYEKWNSFSRVAIFGNRDEPSPPFGWGLSATFKPTRFPPQLVMNIDGAAATWITKFGGDPAELDFLRYDVVNLAHHLRSGARVLVVGVGGGRDILASLAFGQREVVGVEINDDILAALDGPFGDFSGHLGQRRGVRLVNDEARSYVARSDERFDVIQVSLIDTWAATAAGAFTFTENALYTVEAWKLFLEHLTPSGVLSFSRWYYGKLPAETYRMVSLAAEALRQTGVTDPRRHILLVRQSSRFFDQTNGVGTILVGRQPFSAADVARLRQTATTMQFDVMLSPGDAADSTFAGLAEANRRVADASPLDLSPPTDDRPFFFHMLRWRNLFRSDLYEQGVTTFNMKAVFILGALLAVTVVLTSLCVAAPLALTAERAALSGTLPLFVYFAAIGVGFMLIEISQMQRLNVFLGHPTYGLSVALFSLLLSSGVGSYSTAWRGEWLTPRRRFLLLMTALLIFGLLTPRLVHTLAAASTPLRIGAAIAMLAPLGFFMGMAFPLGMLVAARRSATLAPWLWGINGAMSVCASVVALAIALTWGIGASFWSGFVCYGVAALAYLRASRGPAASA